MRVRHGDTDTHSHIAPGTGYPRSQADRTRAGPLLCVRERVSRDCNAGRLAGQGGWGRNGIFASRDELVARDKTECPDIMS